MAGLIIEEVVQMLDEDSDERIYTLMVLGGLTVT